MSWKDPERFELIAARNLTRADGVGMEPVGYFAAMVDGALVGEAEDGACSRCDVHLDIVDSHYETHLDARLGAQGLAQIGFHAIAIKDRETEELLPVTPVTRAEIGVKP